MERKTSSTKIVSEEEMKIAMNKSLFNFNEFSVSQDFFSGINFNFEKLFEHKSDPSITQLLSIFKYLRLNFALFFLTNFFR